ncbi:MAG: uroporphyrinogen-III synthase [Anaerolinea sp.]|nr:uroporphyrinogen-III synthase [Anaerolinea sp.]
MTLNGKRIVITRAAHQSADFAALLIAEGALPLAYPAIQIVPPADIRPLDIALAVTQAGGFDWIVFTSVNAVQAIAARISRIPAETRIAVIGATTAKAVKTHLGLTPEVMPEDGHLLDALSLGDDDRVLLPQSEIAPLALEQGLRERGIDVTAVSAYTVITGSGGVDLPAQKRVDAITFTSGSTVEHFLKRYLNEGGSFPDLERVPLACFGRSARTALKAAGLSPAISAETNALTALVTALKDYFHAE